MGKVLGVLLVLHNSASRRRCKVFGHSANGGKDELSQPFVLVLVVVLVLDSAACSCDVLSPIAWRGAALERIRPARDFRLNADTAEMRENRRLPLTSQRDAITRGLRFAYTRT